jgi:hypothetical protein
MRSVKCVLGSLAVAAFAAAPVTAQTVGGSGSGGKGGMSVGVAGGYYSLGGDDFTTTDAGFGGEASLRYGVSRSFTLKAGVSISSHHDSYIDDNIQALAVSVEPRYMISMPGTPKLTPFIGGRVQWARESATVQGIDLNGSGFGFGGVGGFQYLASPQLAIESSVIFTTQSFGEVKYQGTVVQTSTSGTILGLQFGVVFHFGAK